MNYAKPIVVAEACCNHMGNFDIAKKMIHASKLAGADYVKFQKRYPEDAVPRHMHDQPHPVPRNAFGDTYLSHRKNLEFTIEQHEELSEYCKELGIGYSSSVWDVVSAKEVINLNPDFIKVPSATNTNYDLLDVLFNNYAGDIHISLGMTSKEEKNKLYQYLEPHKQRLVIYWTTSDYPVNFEELFLLEINNLRDSFPKIGFSGHHLGIAVDISAYTLGANWIERHFTLDRTWPGTDQSASLEPQGLHKLCRDLNATYKALNFKSIEFTDGELGNRNKLKYINH